ncbi:MAG: leucine-rich repeat protein [Clostridia bacterium]|nr:leucine-rich repeat protein [Clostridia bacterium]
MKKKLLTTVLSVIIILSVISIISFTAFAERSGIYTYVVIDDEATITNVSTVAEGNIVVPEFLNGYRVTAIGENAFYNCENIINLTIPSYITTIGVGAFSWCTNLQSVDIQGHVERIESSTFYHCKKLENIIIPDTVIFIGSMAFEGCAYCKNENNFKNGVLYIKKCVVDAKVNLSGTCVIESGTKVIACDAFKSCDFKKIILPDSIVTIGDNAFESCVNLNEIVIREGVKYIGISAFAWCSKLENIYIPTTLSEICESSFCGCSSLNKINVPKNIVKICQDAFFECENLKSVSLNTGLTEIGLLAFHNCKQLKSIYIPEGVLSLGYGAFSGCDRLVTVSFPKSLSELENSFDDCNSLTDVYYNSDENQKNKIIGIENEYYLNTSIWHYLENPPCNHAETFWKVIKSAELTDDGLKQETCSWCGEILDSEEIPALGVTYDIENAATNNEESISVAVSAESNLPETVEVKAEKKSSDEKQTTYEIHLENNGVEVQPLSPVLVKLPIPEGFDRDKLNIYRKEADGSKTRMNYIIDGDFVYFETDHFSIYEILEKLCGDINGDGKLNNKDAARLFQYFSGWNVNPKEEMLDINGDGTVDNRDLTRLFQYLSGWTVEIF